jgi:serine/threonine-protein kinase HipA
MSLAGAQHKLLLVEMDGELYEPKPGTPSSHILKPDTVSADYPASAVNEYFTMRLAERVGVQVPVVDYRYVPEPVYIIERFDRAGTVPYQERLHALDTCQLLNKSRVFKYTTATLGSLREAAEYCRQKAATRLQLFRWVLFNILVGNTDNHLKNVTFLVGPGRIELAPAYDLLSTAVYATRALVDERAQWPHVDLTLRVGEARACDEITHADVLAAGRELGLSEATADREAKQMILALPKTAAALNAQLEIDLAGKAEKSTNPAAARLALARDLRLLRAIEHIVIADMVRRVA